MSSSPSNLSDIENDGIGDILDSEDLECLQEEFIQVK